VEIFKKSILESRILESLNPFELISGRRLGKTSGFAGVAGVAGKVRQG